MEISVLASSRALYKINLIVNQEKKFPKVQTLEYVKCLNLLISRYLGKYYQDAFDLLVEELVSDTDKDGMLMYLKERGFYMTVNDFQKYLFEKDAQLDKELDFSDLIDFVAEANTSIVYDSSLFVKEGNDLYTNLMKTVEGDTNEETI